MMNPSVVAKALILLMISVAFLYACTYDYSPRPRAYFRIDYPEKDYQKYEEDCPFRFEYPTYASVHPDTSYDAEYCSKHIYYEPFNAFLHLSYKPINGLNDLRQLQEDARGFVYEHTVKASDIRQKDMVLDEHSTGTVYKLLGNTASALQFYATDTNTHYIRGALYFNAPTNRDSLDPVISFLEHDIMHFMETLEWAYDPQS